MRNPCLSKAPPILELSPKQHSLRQSLYCQHWKHEATTLQVIGKQRGSKAFQRLCGSFGRLGECQGSAPVPRAPICPRDHLLQGDKLSSQ